MRSTSSSRKKIKKVGVVTPAASNRRQHRRIRVDRAAKVQVQVFPVLPFVGTPVDAVLVNLSPGGMALLFDTHVDGFARGSRLNIHFRLPGLPLTACEAVVSNVVSGKDTFWVKIGVKFSKAPDMLTERIAKMISDDDACDNRMFSQSVPRCEAACAFHSLCHKPIRTGSPDASKHFEISLQRTKR